MNRVILLLILILSLGLSPVVHAQLSIVTPGQGYTVDFDNDLPGVNQGAFVSVMDAPIFGTAAGRLDPNAWSYVIDAAVDTAPAVFPGTGNATFNALSNGGVSSTGWGSWNLSGDHAFAVLPSTQYATSGSLTLKCVNNTGANINQLSVDFTARAFNDSPRSNKVSFYYSLDNVHYYTDPSLDFVSSTTATSLWEDGFRTFSIYNLSIASGSYFYLRWVFSDFAGSGARDEFLLDMISVVAQTSGSAQVAGLEIINLNNNNPISATEPFSMTIRAIDNNNQPIPVSTNTNVYLNVSQGSGTLGGNITGVIPSGNTTITISGITYDTPENNVILYAAAANINNGETQPFNVLPPASKLEFVNFPATGQSNVALGAFTVEARRPDQSVDLNYSGLADLSIFSGPGALAGTLSKSFVNGVATFDDIKIITGGVFRLLVTSGFVLPDTSQPITVSSGIMMEELVVPQFMGAKTSASVNNARTPVAFCLKFDNLSPNTPYDVKLTLGITTESASSYGAGNAWNGSAFNQNLVPAAFTTDGNGNSAPVWFFIQPTGNATRFDAGQVHNLRVGITPAGSTMPAVPTFIGSKTITALDIAVNPRTTATTDDGAFIKGKTSSIMSGKYFLIYNNETGTGDPIYSFTIRQSVPTLSSGNTELPGIVDSVWRQLPASDTGAWAAVIPIGANNPNGIRRIEARNADNTLAGFQTDLDGIWPSGANTTNPARRQVVILSPNDAPLMKSLIGTVYYANSASTGMDSTTVFLKDAAGNIIYQTLTNSAGNYSFVGVTPGTYTLSATCNKKWGGASAVDGLAVLKHFVGMGNPLTGINKTAADVTHDTPSSINAVDGLTISKRFVGMISTFPSGDWAFETFTVTIGTSQISQNIKALCFGDVNNSYIPYHQ